MMTLVGRVCAAALGLVLLANCNAVLGIERHERDEAHGGNGAEAAGGAFSAGGSSSVAASGNADFDGGAAGGSPDSANGGVTSLNGGVTSVSGGVTSVNGGGSDATGGAPASGGASPNSCTPACAASQVCEGARCVECRNAERSCAADGTPLLCAGNVWSKQSACAGTTPVCSHGTCVGTRLVGGIVSVGGTLSRAGVQLVEQSLELTAPACSTVVGKCVVGGIRP
ncbi:MAG TPA: hypothetical protein VFQ35_11550 [Polyangiaceae bacterium]|nr:hypothetical protein [Polyangiaceae bacterium]